MDQVLFGGEACDADVVRRAGLEEDGPREVVHVYGPTETTTVASVIFAVRGSSRQGAVPIGAPIGTRRCTWWIER